MIRGSKTRHNDHALTSAPSHEDFREADLGQLWALRFVSVKAPHSSSSSSHRRVKAIRYCNTERQEELKCLEMNAVSLPS